MGTTRASKVKLLTAIGLLASSAALRQEPEEVDLFAKQRILTAIGPGLRAVRQGANGRLYVLASAAPGLVVVDAAGKQLLAIGEEPAATGSAAATHSLITFGEDCDVDAEGGIYVADRGANLIRVFSPDGAPLRSFAVKNPVSVAVLEEDEVAVATLGETHLVMVFDKQGKDVREFGDPEPIAERPELNRFLNIGQLATDELGHLYYAGHIAAPWARANTRTHNKDGPAHRATRDRRAGPSLLCVRVFARAHGAAI